MESCQRLIHNRHGCRYSQGAAVSARCKEMAVLRQFAILLLAGCAFQVQAKVDMTQAARLGSDLTPLGAERAGNAAGTIPAWDGGITSAPAGYQPGMHHLDPFKADAVQYVINSKNMGQYQALLPEGLKALLQKRPEYFLQVYPTRRSVSAPQRIYDATRMNALNAELISGGNGVDGVAAGITFPLPKTGQEAIWNHIMRYRGEQISFVTNQAAVLTNGSYNLLKLERDIYFLYGREGVAPQDLDNTLFYYKYKVVAPSKLSGSALVVHETLDQVLAIPKAWPPPTRWMSTTVRRTVTSGSCSASRKCWCPTTAMRCISRASPTTAFCSAIPSTRSCCAMNCTACGWWRPICARVSVTLTPSVVSTSMRTAGRCWRSIFTTRLAS